MESEPDDIDVLVPEEKKTIFLYKNPARITCLQQLFIT